VGQQKRPLQTACSLQRAIVTAVPPLFAGIPGLIWLLTGAAREHLHSPSSIHSLRPFGTPAQKSLPLRLTRTAFQPLSRPLCRWRRRTPLPHCLFLLHILSHDNDKPQICQAVSLRGFLLSPALAHVHPGLVAGGALQVRDCKMHRAVGASAGGIHHVKPL